MNFIDFECPVGTPEEIKRFLEENPVYGQVTKEAETSVVNIVTGKTSEPMEDPKNYWAELAS